MSKLFGYATLFATRHHTKISVTYVSIQTFELYPVSSTYLWIMLTPTNHLNWQLVRLPAVECDRNLYKEEEIHEKLVSVMTLNYMNWSIAISIFSLPFWRITRHRTQRCYWLFLRFLTLLKCFKSVMNLNLKLSYDSFIAPACLFGSFTVQENALVPFNTAYSTLKLENR